MALLEADVALPVVKRFIDAVRAKAIGTEVQGSLTPGQALVGVIHDELVALMGGEAISFDLRHAQPAVILLAGLQGAGKTTTAGKLARHLVEQKKRVLLASTDIRRPAAVLQLQRLGAVGEIPSRSPGQSETVIAATRWGSARGSCALSSTQQDDAREAERAGGRDIDARSGRTSGCSLSTAWPPGAVNAARPSASLALTGTILTRQCEHAGRCASVREVTAAR